MYCSYSEIEGCSFKELKGKIISSIEVERADSDSIIFRTCCGNIYYMYHDQNCCEDVNIESINGDINELVGSEILIAEERSNIGDIDGGGSFTWTFYTISTKKCTIDIRWYGTSNGYYSESVDFVKKK